jgi:hypothetical protein
MNPKRPTLPLTGGCSCGAIRYRIASFPLLLYACNCTDCQTASGSAFALTLPVSTADFHVLKGQPRGWYHASPSGADVTSWFCGDCGARIYGSRQSRPDSINIRAGTLDDTTSGRAYVHAKRPALGSACDKGRMPRNATSRFPAAGRKVARDVAGVLSEQKFRKIGSITREPPDAAEV